MIQIKDSFFLFVVSVYQPANMPANIHRIGQKMIVSMVHFISPSEGWICVWSVLIMPIYNICECVGTYEGVGMYKL